MGNIYELLSRLFFAPLHQGQQLVKVYKILPPRFSHASCHGHDCMGIVYRHGEHTHGPTLENRPGGWPLHQGQQLVTVYRILLSDSIMLLTIIMTVWALSTAMVNIRMTKALKEYRVF